MDQNYQTGWGVTIRCLMMFGWLTLPFSNLKWLPELGITRPLCGLFFALALGAVFFSKVRRKGFGYFVIPAKAGIQYSHYLMNSRLRGNDDLGRMQRNINLSGAWGFLKNHLRQLPGWKFLRWWLILIILGALSAALTPFYGAPWQALNRLLGYGLIIVFLSCAFYSLKAYRMETIARWISLGYVPVLPYAIIEALATQKVYWAYQAVKWVRHTMIVPYRWVERTAFLTTEPSFLSFQLILLIAISPFLKSRALRVINLLLIIIAILFSKSGMLFLIISGYGIFYLFFSLSRGLRGWSIAALSFMLVFLGALYRLSLAAWWMEPFQKP